jgi:hypothetical protein
MKTVFSQYCDMKRIGFGMVEVRVEDSGNPGECPTRAVI